MFAPLVAKLKPQRAAAAAPRLSRAAVMHGQLLQRTIGNQAMLRLLGQGAGMIRSEPGPVQAKVKVGAVNDPLEHEADRIAKQVMRAPAAEVSAAPPQVSRKCAECAEEDKLQRKPGGLPRAAEAPAIVHEVLRSSGQPLDAATRADMEPRFGHDFSRVRIHVDGRAAESAREVRARAYTVGPHVVFSAGEYAPATPRGRSLLAHELAHTIQQRSSSLAPPSPAPGGIFERSAEAAGRDVANGSSVSGALPACGVGLSRVPLQVYDDQMFFLMFAERKKKPDCPREKSCLDAIEEYKAEAARRDRVRALPPEIAGDLKKFGGTGLGRDRHMRILTRLRWSDPDNFVAMLIRNEMQLYPLLSSYGFHGSWVKNDDYLKDFDKAVKTWGGASLIDTMRPPSPPDNHARVDTALPLDQYRSMSLQAEAEMTLGAIEGGLFGAIGYGMGGVEGAQAGVPLDGMLTALGGTHEARASMPHQQPVRQKDSIAPRRHDAPDPYKTETLAESEAAVAKRPVASASTLAGANTGQVPPRAPVRRVVIAAPAAIAPHEAPGAAAIRSGPLSPAEERIQTLARNPSRPGKEITVGIQAKVLVSGEPVLTRIKSASFSQLDKSRAAALGGTGRAAVLPEVKQPRWTRGKAGFTQPSSGLIVQPQPESRELEILAWNTGEPQKGDNPSHAERQFMNWFEGQDPRWKARVTSVNVTVYGRDICETCASDIKKFSERPDHKHITFNWVRGDTGRPFKPPKGQK